MTTFQLLKAVCVEQCPLQGESPRCKANLGECTSEGKVKATLFDTKVAMRTYCIPTRGAMQQAANQLFKLLDEQFSFGQYMADVVEASGALLLMMVVTFFVAMLYIILLRWFVKPILYTSMVLILVFFILLGGWCWIKRSEFDPALDYEKRNYDYVTYGAITAWIIAGVYLCFMCCCFSNIALGASVMQAASAFVS